MLTVWKCKWQDRIAHLHLSVAQREYFQYDWGLELADGSHSMFGTLKDTKQIFEEVTAECIDHDFAIPSGYTQIPVSEYYAVSEVVSEMYSNHLVIED